MRTQQLQAWILVAAMTILISMGSLRADWTIEGESVSYGMSEKPIHQKMVYRVCEKMLRLDIGGSDGMSTIMNNETGERVSLMHATKTYVRASISMLKEQREQLEQYAKDNPDLFPKEVPKATPTGKTDTINGFKVQEYTTACQSRKQTFWMTKDVPHVEALRQAIDRAQGPTKIPTVDPESLPGFAVRIEIKTKARKGTLAGGYAYNAPAMKTILTMTSIKEEPIVDSVFDIPEGYTESVTGPPSHPERP